MLSAEQEQAARTTDSALVVVAGAGSGKTELVAQRLERLLQGTDPDGFRVLALTYTVKAADELRERLRLRLGDLSRRVDADTTHQFAMGLILQHGTRLGLPPEPEVLVKDEDRLELLTSWLRNSGRSEPTDPKAVLNRLDLARARRQDAPYLAEWREALANGGQLDYPAMLDHAIELASSPWIGRQLRALYGQVVVDEAQNMTEAQYALLRAIVGEPFERHLDTMLVGDERQSIVGFAGADPGLIRRFEHEYSATRIELTTNYRSARRIAKVGREVARQLGLASEVETNYPASGIVDIAALDSEELEGEFLANWVGSLLRDGAPAHILAPGESTQIRPREIAILARSAAALRFARAALDARDIQTALTVSEDDWVRSPQARLALAVVGHLGARHHRAARREIARLCDTEEDFTDVGLVVSVGSNTELRPLSALCRLEDVSHVLPVLRGLSIEDPDWPDDLNQFESAWTSFSDRFGPVDRNFSSFRQHISRSLKGDNLSDGVRLLTVHRAQGREFKAVAITGCNEGQLPDFRATTLEDRSGELRIFYVAVSRASRILAFTRSRARVTRYGVRATKESTFLDLARRALS